MQRLSKLIISWMAGIVAFCSLVLAIVDVLPSYIARSYHQYGANAAPACFISIVILVGVNLWRSKPKKVYLPQTMGIPSPPQAEKRIAGDLQSIFSVAARRDLHAPKITESASVAGLPVVPDHIGRETEIEILAGYMLAEPPKPSLILGSPGMGKSTIAIAAVHNRQVANRFGSRRFFARLNGATSVSDLISEVAATLGVESPFDLQAAIFKHLSAEPALLVLDNFETPWDSDRPGAELFLADLARAAPQTSVCVSIRGVDYPGSVSWNTPIRAERLDAADSRSEFLTVASERFASDPDLSGLLQDIDGVPLAISLVAHRAFAEPSLSNVATQWRTERARQLKPGPIDDVLTCLAASYEVSIQSPRITGAAKRFLSLLATLPDGVAHLDILAFFGDTPAEAAEAANLLLGMALAFDEAGRIRLHPPLSSYIRDCYPPSDSDCSRAAGHYLDMAQLAANIGTDGGREAVVRLTPEVVNVARAIERVLGSSDPCSAIAAAGAIAEFYSATGLGSIGILDLSARRALEIGDPGGAASLHFRAGDIALLRSDYESARKSYEEALPLYKSMGDVKGEANCIGRLGDIALLRRDYESARKSYEEALPLYRRVGDVPGEVNCIKGLGDVALERGDYISANKSYEDALPLYRRVADYVGEANCTKGLGVIAYRSRDNGSSRLYYEEALQLFRSVGDVLGEANCIKGFGDIARRRREHKSAWMRYEEAIPLYRFAGSILGEANCIQSLGDISRRYRDHAAARKCYLEALALYEGIPEPYSIGVTHWRLSRVSGEPEEHLNAAREAWAGIGMEDLIDKYLVDPGARA